VKLDSDTSEKSIRYGRRFQYFGGAELGLWRIYAETSEVTTEEHRLCRLGNLAQQYRKMCLDVADDQTKPCLSFVDEIEKERAVLSLQDARTCQLPVKIVTEEGKKRSISRDVLLALEACAIRTRELQRGDISLTKVGGSIRVTHTGGRDLPSLTTFEIGVGVVF
jgi:hypothetical protein